MLNILEHLKDRHFDLNLYTSFISENEGFVTFVLWNLSGQMVGYHQYKPFQPKNDLSIDPRELRYFTYITKTITSQMHTAFGLELLNHKDRVIFLCEGIFDACRLHNRGLNALALFSSNNYHLKDWLNSLGFKLISVCEGDESGLLLDNMTYNDNTIYLPCGKDLGSLSEDEISFYFRKYLFT